MNIQKVHIDKIRPYWRNPRNNEKAVPAVKESIKRFGYNSPIVVDKENVIIAGHTRYKALRELGYTTIPVVVLDISEEKAKQYRIADNKSAEKADWDDDLLMYELREIEELADMKIFFDNGEIDALLDIVNEDYDFDDDEDDYDEEERRAELHAQARATIAATIPEDEEVDDQEIEARINAKVEDDMRNEIREEMQRENERIKELEKKEQERFQQKSEERESDYIEIQCPHCDERYVLSKSELLRANKLRRTL